MALLKRRAILKVFVFLAMLMSCHTFNIYAQQGESNFSIIVETNKASYDVGGTIEYTIKVKNISSSTARDIMISDELPSNVKVISTDGKINSNKIIWEKEELQPGEEVTLNLSIQLNEVVVTPPLEGDDTEDSIPPAEDDTETPPLEGDDTEDSIPPAEDDTETPPLEGDDTEDSIPPAEDDTETPPYESGTKPSTGYRNISLLVMGIIFIGLGYWTYKVRGSKLGKFFVLIFLLSMIPMVKANAESINVSQEYTHSVKINDENIESHITVIADMFPIEESQPELVELSLTLFIEESQPLSNEMVEVKIEEEELVYIESSEMGFLKIQVPKDSSITIKHKSVEADITVDSNGEVGINNIKGEVVIGCMSRSEAGLIVFRDNVIDLNTEQLKNIVKLDLETGEFIYDGNLNLKEDDILFIPAFEEYISGVAIKIVELKLEDSQTKASIIQPELYEIYESMDVEMEPTLENAQFILADGVELEEDVTTERLGITTGSKKSATFKLLDLPVDDIDVKGKVKLVLDSSIKVKFKRKLKEIEMKKLQFEFEFKIDGEVGLEYMDIPDKVEFTPQLGYILIPTSAPGVGIKVPLYLKIKPTGTLKSTIDVGAQLDVGFKYSPKSGLKLFPAPDDRLNLNFDIKPVKFEGGVKIGPDISAMLALFGRGIAGIEVGAGLKAEANVDVGVGTGGVNACLSASLNLYSEVGVKSEVLEDFGYKLDELSREFYIKEPDKSFGLCGNPDLKVSPERLELAPGESEQLIVTSKEEDITKLDTITYKSEDSSKVSVNDDGLVTGKEKTTEPINIIVSYERDGLTSTQVVPVEVVEKGTLTGRVYDIQSRDSLEGVKISTMDSDYQMIEDYTDSSGNYSLELRQNKSYVLTFEKDGYITKDSIISLSTESSKKDYGLLSSEAIKEGEGIIYGKILEVETDKYLSEVEIKFYKKTDNNGEELVKTIHTNDNGEYEIALLAGEYTAYIEKQGYELEVVYDIVVEEEVYKEINRIYLSPELSDEIVEIPDTYLRQAIYESCLNCSDPLTKSDLAKVTSLRWNQWLSSSKIKDLTGLEHMINLRELNLGGNQISDLTPLSNLTNLYKLNLPDNQISDINALGNLTNLEYLRLYGNQISDIKALGNLTNLRYLQLDRNQISDIKALGNLTNLTELYLSDNQITDITALGNLTDLWYLQLDRNQISDIKALGNLTNLRDLYLDENQITDITVLGNLTDLWCLQLDRNQISDIKALGNLTNLTYLYLDENQISDVTALGNLTNLDDLHLQKNQISDVKTLGNLTNLDDLHLQKNQISDVTALGNLTNLNNLNLSENQISDVTALGNLTDLWGLQLDRNQISDVTALGNLTDLWGLQLDRNQISDVTALGNLTNLSNLNLSENQISDVTALGNLTNLSTLDLRYNQISDIGALSNLINTQLYLEGNPIIE